MYLGWVRGLAQLSLSLPTAGDRPTRDQTQ